VGENLAERVGAGLIVGNSLLTARGGPAAGEGDLKTNVAMLLLDRLGAGGSYTEFYALDFDEQFVLMGHDGPGHLAIAEGRPVARALRLYHGKAGAGLSIEMKVRLGPVTILGVTQTADGRLKLVAAEGESIPGPTFRIGNTNSRIRFASGPAAFFDAWCAEGPTHHVALGVGHQLGRLRKVADLLGLELAVVG
jgi:L-arabinose isomerase